MEGWEKVKREELEKTISDGFYDIGTESMTILTGKGGYINFLIELHRSTKKLSKDYIKTKK